jgi:hypothetical protein
MAKGLPWLPVKPIVTGLFIDGAGEEAWKVMVRRARLMFGAERCTSYIDFSSRKACRESNVGISEPDPQQNRALTLALRALRDSLAEASGKRKQSGEGPVTLTLIAHSAGSFVLNQTLRVVPDLHATNIVYMAAAAPIADYESTLLGDGTHTGYLAQPQNRDTQVYHLALHPQAELSESYLGWLDITPRGSLLQWIDAFLSEPKFDGERTAGRASTLATSLARTPRPLASRVHVKIFDYGVKHNKCDSSGPLCQPQRHGDFSDTRFWDPSFWNPGDLAHTFHATE